MKKGTFLLSLFLSILILFNTLRVSVTYIYYSIDPIGFIEKLCENKDTPEMQCNGKCQLKKVTKSSQSSEKAPINLIDFKDIILYKQASHHHSVVSFFEKNKSLFFYSNNYSYLNSKLSFHPPKV